MRYPLPLELHILRGLYTLKGHNEEKNVTGIYQLLDLKLLLFISLLCMELSKGNFPHVTGMTWGPHSYHLSC